jgi:hypothetical protein
MVLPAIFSRRGKMQPQTNAEINAEINAETNAEINADECR